MPGFLQGPLLGYNWIDAIISLIIYGTALFFVIQLLPAIIEFAKVLFYTMMLPYDAIKNRRWYLLVYALPFLPYVRAHISLAMGLAIATVLAIVLYYMTWKPYYGARLQVTKEPSTVKPSLSVVEDDNGTGPNYGQQPIRQMNDQSNNFHVHTQRDKKAFDNVVGMEKAKTELKDAIEMLLYYPDKIKKYDLKPASGLILYGPPGTGKTHLAIAAAAYFGAEFFLVNATSIIGQYVGTTEAAVKEVFQKARKKTPSIIFFDEIDAIGQKRDGRSMNRPSDIVLNLLLTELDGFQKREGVFVIAATNRLDTLDDALLRPGRFELKIEVPAPNEDERIELLKFFGRKKPLDPAIDLREIAKATEGLTGAYLEGLVNGATKRALKRAIKNGSDERITYEDFLAVLPDLAV